MTIFKMRKIGIHFSILQSVLILCAFGEESPSSGEVEVRSKLMMSTFPESGVYSLFPHEDLSTGRRLLLNQRSRKNGDLNDPRASKIRGSYRRLNDIYENYPKTRVYYDEDRLKMFKLYNPRIKLNNVGGGGGGSGEILGRIKADKGAFSPPTPPFDRFVPLKNPELYAQDGKLPSRNKFPNRFHVFDPNSKSALAVTRGGGSSSTSSGISGTGKVSEVTSAAKLRISSAPSSSFLNHDEYLEFHTKKALAELTEQGRTSTSKSIAENFENNEKKEESSIISTVDLDIDDKKEKDGFKPSQRVGANGSFNPPLKFSNHLGEIDNDNAEESTSSDPDSSQGREGGSRDENGITRGNSHHRHRPKLVDDGGNRHKLSHSSSTLAKITKGRAKVERIPHFQPSYFARGIEVTRYPNIQTTTSRIENGIEFGTEGHVEEESSSSKENIQAATTTSLLRPYISKSDLHSKEKEKYKDKERFTIAPEFGRIRSNQLRESKFLRDYLAGEESTISTTEGGDGDGDDDDDQTEESSNSDQDMITFSPNGHFSFGDPPRGRKVGGSTGTQRHVSTTRNHLVPKDRIKNGRNKIRVKSEKIIKYNSSANAGNSGKSGMVHGNDLHEAPPTTLIFLESSESIVTSMTGNGNGSDIIRVMRVKGNSSPNKIDGTVDKTDSLMSIFKQREEELSQIVSEYSLESSSSSTHGIVSKVHAHISHCPKLHDPAEIICDVHVREHHNNPHPQLTVGWRRKYHNESHPDEILAVNKTITYGESQQLHSHSSSDEDEYGENIEDFHDKFNVTLAPGISPMLRSVLLIRAVTAPDTGNYLCEVYDGENTLKSDTLLFLCH